MVTPAIPSSEQTAPAGRALIPLLAAGALMVAAGVTAIILLADAERYRQLVALVESPFGLVVLFGASVLCNATLILPVPGMALTGAAALVVDPLLVGVVAGAGQAVGELSGYLAGRSGRRLLAGRPALGRIGRWMDRNGTITLFVLALVPNPAFDVAGILAGALRTPVPRFLAAVGSAKVLRNTLFAYAVVAGIGWLASLLGQG